MITEKSISGFISNLPVHIKHLPPKIHQYSMEGELIQIWDNINDIVKRLRKCLKGYSDNFNNFIMEE